MLLHAPLIQLLTSTCNLIRCDANQAARKGLRKVIVSMMKNKGLSNEQQITGVKHQARTYPKWSVC